MEESFFFTSYGKGVKPSNEIAMGPDSARCQVSSILVSSVNIKIFTILWKTLFCFEGSIAGVYRIHYL